MTMCRQRCGHHVRDMDDGEGPLKETFAQSGASFGRNKMTSSAVFARWPGRLCAA
jgi:hypothetical protein